MIKFSKCMHVQIRFNTLQSIIVPVSAACFPDSSTINFHLEKYRRSGFSRFEKFLSFLKSFSTDNVIV